MNVPVPLKAGFQKVKCEIQLRTIAMDLWASLEHHLRYKKDLIQNEEIDQELKHCADVLNETDQTMQRIAERMKVFN